MDWRFPAHLHTRLVTLKREAVMLICRVVN